MRHLTNEEANRFNNKFYEKNDCWIWSGYLDKDGYGTIYFRGATRKAHRVAWFSVNGEIQPGHVINHTCRNRACVNPQHLQSITASENTMKDSRSVGYINSQKKSCKKGHPYDATEHTGSRTIRICSICRKEKRLIATKKRQKLAKEKLRV